MSKIVIGVACHKPSELPDNEIYLPIHVGSACSERILPGLQRDDEGDNISEKNPFYCELTAQYWLWKNVDADYYGLCHYRRFMSFAPEKYTNYTTDNRKQVSINSLNEWSKEKYYLNNAPAMHELIEQYDVVATEEQDLTKVFTPRGRKSTVYDHFAAHDRDLINVNDLDAMLAIAEDKFPEIFPDLKEYISNKYFRGFNCYVMKKELFFQLCEFEFSVLEELEKHVNLTNYDATKTRIYGFMAEILYSGFLYHLKKQKLADVKDVQMLYFQDTDPIVCIDPIEDAIPVCINAVDAQPFILDVTLRSVLKYVDTKKRYDILLLSDTLTSFYRKKYSNLVANFPNVSLRYLDWEHMLNALLDRRKNPVIAPQLYLPWFLEKYEKILFIDWNTLYKGDVSQIFDISLEGYSIGASRDILSISEANDIYGEREKYLKETLKINSTQNYFNPSVLLMDLRQIRSRYCLENILNEPLLDSSKIASHEALNYVFNGDTELLPQKYALEVSSDPLFALQIQDAPKWLSDEYNSAKSNAIILCYDPDDPWWPIGMDFEAVFWSYARESEFYPYFMAEMANVHVLAGGKRTSKSAFRRYVDKILPKGSKRREFVKNTVSPKQYQMVRKLYSRVSAR